MFFVKFNFSMISLIENNINLILFKVNGSPQELQKLKWGEEYSPKWEMRKKNNLDGGKGRGKILPAQSPPYWHP
jgi:hypothetical protein